MIRLTRAACDYRKDYVTCGWVTVRRVSLPRRLWRVFFPVRYPRSSIWWTPTPPLWRRLFPEAREERRLQEEHEQYLREMATDEQDAARKAAKETE